MLLILKFQPGMKCLHVFFSFFILGWKFFPVFLTGMNSSRDEISSRQKRVNSKRHFTIDRDDFVQGRVSSRDEISSVNTLLNIKQFLFFLIKNMVYRKKHFITILFFFLQTVEKLIFRCTHMTPHEIWVDEIKVDEVSTKSRWSIYKKDQ